MKRPMIFIGGLTQKELNQLAELSDFDTLDILSEITQYTQVYTYTDGTLQIADTPSISRQHECECKSYDEFVTKWGQYKLWLLL